ncbi:histone-lysine N-methyltransferase ASHR3 [Olea europaea subsp. europaea]|uniref:Histone-lysine N-methyltransferase ASHR3 n=1 Tax=Olea europaea subsp. europaea TaxID=158383 RepID=A0A8S0QIY5_OLEEU|nr:histone-lysine N-methyltransferase ASHR3 [Olea europaea subsp. europaea]
MVQCLVCQYAIYGEAILCSVCGCQASFHLKCAKDEHGFSSLKQFKCPQHACFLCKRENRLWRCRHPTDWLLSKHEVPATRIEEIFSCLPLPYNDEEFKTDINWKDLTENKLEPPPYEQIKRNFYLIKRKRSKVDADTGCASCSSTECSEACMCRVQYISCSKGCRCKGKCQNRPFNTEKKIQIVKVKLMRFSFSIISFVLFYNSHLFLLYGTLSLYSLMLDDVNFFFVLKRQVDGEIRVGVFAATSIQVGEPLTYDYRFEQFGPEVECLCGVEIVKAISGIKRRLFQAGGIKGRSI